MTMASDGRKTVVMDRTKSRRFPPGTEFVTLRTKLGGQTAARIEDESFDGIKLSLEFTIGIGMRDGVYVVHDGFAMPAVVRQLELRDGGIVVADLEWTARSKAILS